MKAFITALLLLVASSPLFAQKGTCWSVSNISNPTWGTCPYTVSLSMVLVNSSQQVLPNSGVSVSHTITTGSSASYCYPQTIPAGYTPKLVGAYFSHGGNQYDLPLTESAIYSGLSNCNAPCNLWTFWQIASSNGFQIGGDCVLGGG